MYALAARRASCTSFRRFACTCSLLWCCLAVSPSPPSLSATTSSSLVSAARVRPSAALPSTHTLGSIRKLLGGALPLVRRRRLLHRQRPSEYQYDLIVESISLQPEYSPSHVDRCCHQRCDQLRHPAPSLHLRREQRRYATRVIDDRIPTHCSLQRCATQKPMPSSITMKMIRSLTLTRSRGSRGCNRFSPRRYDV